MTYASCIFIFFIVVGGLMEIMIELIRPDIFYSLLKEMVSPDIIVPFYLQAYCSCLGLFLVALE